MHTFSFSFVHFWSSRPLGVWGTYKKLERTTYCIYVYTRLLDAAAAVRPWQWCGKQHHGVGKVWAKGRVTSETQQGEIGRSVHTFPYHPARLPLCPANFGAAPNHIVNPKNWSPKKRRPSVLYNDFFLIFQTH